MQNAVVTFHSKLKKAKQHNPEESKLLCIYSFFKKQQTFCFHILGQQRLKGAADKSLQFLCSMSPETNHHS